MVGASVETAAEATLLIVFGGVQTQYALAKPLVTIGRRPDRDVVMAEPHVSRNHAQIERRGAEYFIVDLGSSHGTFVNGQATQSQRLQGGDRIELGAIGGSYMVFRDSQLSGIYSPDPREMLSVIMSRQTSSDKPGELHLLNVFIEGARALNSASVLSEVLTNLVEASLRLTKAERGFVFLCKENGRLELAAGRSERGDILVEAKGISQSVLNEVIASSSEFVMSMGDPGMTGRESIIAHDLRSIVCIPLRKSHFRDNSGCGEHGAMGVLYLDSRIEKGKLPDVSHELISAIAHEAAALVENAYLVKSEQESLAYQRELAIASTIQQSLMEVKIPSLSFAQVEARNISCKEIGGDFYDVMRLADCVAVVVADVSGKGISAALLAAVLQGAIDPQLRQGLPLEQIAAGLNLYIYNKIVGQKYATLLMMKLYENGELEYLNCGHVKPLLYSEGAIRSLENENLPVGLLSPVTFTSGRAQLRDGDRVLLFTDGVVEAENQAGDFLGNEGLEAALASEFSLGRLFTAVDAYRAQTPLSDDCTALCLRYGRKAS